MGYDSECYLFSLLEDDRSKLPHLILRCQYNGRRKYVAALYYVGYKQHAVCGVSSVIHSYDMTKASVRDIKYLNVVEQDYFSCTFIGNKAYLRAEIKYNLSESANIQFKVPYRYNQKQWKPFAKARERLEKNFSQFTDQFNIMRNYTKDNRGFFMRIIIIVSAFTVSQ